MIGLFRMPCARCIGKPWIAFANAMPFAELVRALGDPPSPTHNPIFDVRFALQNHPVPDVDLPGLSARLQDALDRHRSFPPRLRDHRGWRDAGGGLAIPAESFSQADIETLDRMFQAVLANACRSSESRIAVLMT